MVKNIELYNLIQSIIQKQKYQQFTTKQNFIANRVKTEASYLDKSLHSSTKEPGPLKLADVVYREYMRNSRLKEDRKNNILSKGSKKIKHIMKGFRELENFVDFPEMMKTISAKIQEELIQRKKKTELQSKKLIDGDQIYMKPGPNDQQSNEDEMSYTFDQFHSQKAQKFLESQRKNRIKAYLEKQKEVTNQVIEGLQRNSVEINKYRLRNNNFDKTYTAAFRDEKQKNNQSYSKCQQASTDQLDPSSTGIDCTENKQDLNQQLWKSLGSGNNKINVQRHQMYMNMYENKKNQLKKEQNRVSSSVEYAALMHRAASYLQIILQREHIKKWKIDKQKDRLANSLQKSGPKVNQKSYRLNTKSSHKFKHKLDKQSFIEKMTISQDVQKTKIKAQSNKPKLLQRNSMPLFCKTMKSEQEISSGSETESKLRFQNSELITKSVNSGFNFKRRKVKQKCLEMIANFQENIQFAERQIIKGSKDIQDQINKIQENIQIDYNLMGSYIRPHEHLELCPKKIKQFINDIRTQ